MKTKLYLLFWLFALVPLAFTSCDDDETFVDETTLSTSLSSVTFTKDGGQQSVSITTSATTWVATSPLESSWLTLTQNGAQLDITAAPNTEGVDRKGYILVNAGSAAAKINVVQSAGDVVLSLSTESLSFEKAGGEQRIDVICNESFTVEADEGADWLSISYVEGADFFNLSVTPNEGTEARNTKIFVTAGTTIKELAVVQNGEELIVLPLLAEAGSNSIVDVFQFEEARGNVAITFPDGLFNNAFYFASKNPNFPQIAYMGEASGDYSQAMTATTDESLLPAIKEALVAKGFTAPAPAEGQQDGEGDYTHTSIPYIVNVAIDGGVTIYATYSPIQEEQHPTFNIMPLTEQLSWMACAENDVHGYTFDELNAWELEAGSTFDAASSTYPATGDVAMYTPSEAEQAEGMGMRIYWLYNTISSNPVAADDPFLGEVRQARLVCPDFEKVYWTSDGSSFYMTNEFQALLEEAGYEYIGQADNYQGYKKDAGDGMVDILMFGLVQFSDLFVGEICVDFQAYKDLGIYYETASIYSDKDKTIELINRMNARVKKDATPLSSNAIAK